MAGLLKNSSSKIASSIAPLINPHILNDHRHKKIANNHCKNHTFSVWLSAQQRTMKMNPLTKSNKFKLSFPTMKNQLAKLTALAAISLSAALSTTAQAAHPGEALYKTKCFACHQATGQGIPAVFPPLAGSEWVNGPEENLVRIQLRGLMGPITVKGAQYNSAMPGNPTMTDQEIADVLTYVRSNMTNNAPAISADTVKAIRAKEAGNANMLTVKDLIDPLAAKANPKPEPKAKVAPQAQPNANVNTEAQAQAKAKRQAQAKAKRQAKAKAKKTPKPQPQSKAKATPAPTPSPAAAVTTPVAAASSSDAGQTLYQAKCIACHGPTGDGIPNAFPPLAGSEWVNGPAENLIKIQLHGLAGPIEVKGKLYNGMMPANAAMTNQEIADVLTYVRSNMGNNAPAITPDMVQPHRAAAKANPAPITAADLLDPTAVTAVLTADTELQGFKPAQHNSSGNTIFWIIGLTGICTLPAAAGLIKN